MKLYAEITIGLFMLWLSLSPVLADTITVSFHVTGTAVYSFSGYCSPNSVVTFLENGVSVGTTTSDSAGYFSKDIEKDDETSHTFSYYCTDSSGDTSSTLSTTSSTTINNNVTTSEIVVPPTIELAATSVDVSDSVSISGYTIPNSTVTVTINSLTITKTTTSNSSGYWSVSVPASEIGSGSHTVSTVVTMGSTTSASSSTLSFNITGSVAGSTATPTPATATTTPTPTVIQYLPADFNKDRAVNNIDLGLFLANFEKSVTKNIEIFDLNNDGKIDIVDFSILLYYFSRT